MLSPGCVSYHFSTRVAPRQPSSDRSPSMVKLPDAREMRIGSPASDDCATACAGATVARASTTTALRVNSTDLVVLYIFTIDRSYSLPRAPRLRSFGALSSVESPAGRERKS